MAKYYGMMMRVDGHWSFEAGSFDRSDITFEIDDYVNGYHDMKRKDLKLVVFNHEPQQHEIDYMVREWNGEA